MKLNLTPNEVEAFSVTTVLQFLVSLTYSAILVSSPILTKEAGLHGSKFGIFLSFMYIGTILASSSSGSFVKKFGPLRISQVSMLLMAVALLILCDPTFTLIGLALFVYGIGFGPIMPSSSDILVRAIPKSELAFTLSLKQIAGPLGITAAGFFIPWMAYHFNFKVGLIAVAVFVIAITLFTNVYRKQEDADRDPKASIKMKDILGMFKFVWNDNVLRKIGIVSFLYQGLQTSVMGFLSIYLVHHSGYSLVFAGAAISAMNIGAIPGRLLWGYLAKDKEKIKILFGIIGIFSCLGVWLITYSSPAWGNYAILTLCALTGAVCLGWKGLFLACVALEVPEDKVSSVTGGANCFSFFGAIVFPLLFTAITHFVGYNIAFQFTATCCGLAGLYMIFKKKRAIA